MRFPPRRNRCTYQAAFVPDLSSVYSKRDSRSNLRIHLRYGATRNSVSGCRLSAGQRLFTVGMEPRGRIPQRRRGSRKLQRLSDKRIRYRLYLERRMGYIYSECGKSGRLRYEYKDCGGTARRTNTRKIRQPAADRLPRRSVHRRLAELADYIRFRPHSAGRQTYIKGRFRFRRI